MASGRDDRNAGSRVVEFFSEPAFKDGKQAEFLVHESFPWNLVEHVGVYDEAAARQVRQALASADHRPRAAVERAWYY